MGFRDCWLCSLGSRPAFILSRPYFRGTVAALHLFSGGPVALPAVLHELYQPRSLLLDIAGIEADFAAARYMTTKVFVRGQIEGGLHSLRSASWLWRRSLSFAQVVPGDVAFEYQETAPSPPQSLLWDRSPVPGQPSPSRTAQLGDGQDSAAAGSPQRPLRSPTRSTAAGRGAAFGSPPRPGGALARLHCVAAASNHLGFGAWLKREFDSCSSGLDAEISGQCQSLLWDYEVAADDLMFSAAS